MCTPQWLNGLFNAGDLQKRMRLGLNLYLEIPGVQTVDSWHRSGPRDSFHQAPKDGLNGGSRDKSCFKCGVCCQILGYDGLEVSMTEAV